MHQPQAIFAQCAPMSRKGYRHRGSTKLKCIITCGQRGFAQNPLGFYIIDN